MGGLNEGCEWFAVGTGDPLKVSPRGNEVIRDASAEEVSQRGEVHCRGRLGGCCTGSTTEGRAPSLEHPLDPFPAL